MRLCPLCFHCTIMCKVYDIMAPFLCCVCMCMYHTIILRTCSPLLFAVLLLLLLRLLVLRCRCPPPPPLPASIALPVQRTWHPFYELNAAIQWIQCEMSCHDSFLRVCVSFHWTRISSIDVILGGQPHCIHLFDKRARVRFRCASPTFAKQKHRHCSHNCSSI